MEPFSPAFELLRDVYGFVPNLFRAQSLLPKALDAESAFTASLLLRERALSRVQKERILLVVSAVNRNSYCATLHYQNSYVFGVAERQLDQIVADYRQADLQPTDIAILDAAVGLGAGGAPIFDAGDSILETVLIAAWAKFLCTLATGLDVAPDFEPIQLPTTAAIPLPGSGNDHGPRFRLRPDLEAEIDGFRNVMFSLRELQPPRDHQYSESQVLEAAVATSFAAFLNTLEVGLGAKPESSNTVHLLAPNWRPTVQSPPEDPDAELVARVRGGELDAFEDLMSRHSRRIYRTLVGILGNPEEARDAMQETFLKAFQHLGNFERRSKFSTWLVSIASNTGLQLLRERKRLQSIDDERMDSDEGFRPKELRSWADDPEQLYSKAEVRALVESSVMQLPAKYRVVLVLRDIEQLSIEEAAVALGLGIPALKARLLRGRLMVREALSPRFARSAKGGAA